MGRQGEGPPNPVPFNPDGLTIRQAKECAELVRWLFSSVDRVDRGEVPVENLLYHIQQARDQFRKTWSR